MILRLTMLHPFRAVYHHGDEGHSENQVDQHARIAIHGASAAKFGRLGSKQTVQLHRHAHASTRSQIDLP